MENELYRAIRTIRSKNLNNEDKEELLKIFMVTENSHIRNHIAFIFADIRYDRAVPNILKKINDKRNFNNNGSLVYSLESFNMKKHFIPIIKIICKQEYESRLIAYGILEKLVPFISNSEKIRGVKILEDYRVKLDQLTTGKGENSTLHFIEKTKELLESENVL